jgi:hypothetical protein
MGADPGGAVGSPRQDYPRNRTRRPEAVETGMDKRPPALFEVRELLCWRHAMKLSRHRFLRQAGAAVAVLSVRCPAPAYPCYTPVITAGEHVKSVFADYAVLVVKGGEDAGQIRWDL